MFLVRSLSFCHQFSSIAQSCPTHCNPMNCSTPGLPIHHQYPEFTQTHVHRVGDAIQPSHPLSSSSRTAPNSSQHQNLFQWVGSLHQVAKVFKLQHQSFQWMFRVDFLYDGLVWSPCSPISTSHWYNVCMSRLYRNFFLFFFLKDFNCFKENYTKNSITFNLVFFATVQVYW